ncbi:hypothetical protein GGI23_000071 [Coemansia sp. RSA 2559]|nr:hypothetical protein GGI23_000071 [Coemansia sp. RSA 2559]KAJ2869688.1 hypothetical protein GGI22_000088 [Coemansia erecta]
MAPRKSLPPDISAADLDGLVVVSGPRKCLPPATGCTRRKLEPGLTYRPIVEVRDGSERLYSKNNLPLFEILGAQQADALVGAENATTDSKDNSGPAGAVLRRRRSGIVKGAKHVGNGKDVEDVSDEHYRKLHRKPEYVEKRIRNREIELYQYSRWQESQHMKRAATAAAAATTATAIEASGAPAEAIMDGDALLPIDVISEALRKLESSDDADNSTASSHRRQRRRKELLALADSVGLQKAQRKQQKQDSLKQQQLLLQQQKQRQKQQMEQKMLRQASEHDRKLSRLGGVILEQFLVQAARLPPEPLANYNDMDKETEEDKQNYPCCPREFALPPRMYNQVIKHRNISATD